MRLRIANCELRISGWIAAVVAGVTAAGCVRRTLTIHTEPAGALVHVNDEEVGRSPVSTDFLWYGDYGIIIRKEGYAALQTHEQVREPWYQIPPFDFWAEVLWPGRFHDQHSFSYELEPQQLPNRDELLERAGELRDQAVSQTD